VSFLRRSTPKSRPCDCVRRQSFDVSPGGKEIWAANAQEGTISIIDVASKKVTETLAANVRGAKRLKFTPDGKRVFISSLGGSDVMVLVRPLRGGGNVVRKGRRGENLRQQWIGIQGNAGYQPL
jgi:YVTN family beta-propeller protein